MRSESECDGAKIGVRITEGLERKIETEAERRGVDTSVAMAEICREILTNDQPG